MYIYSFEKLEVWQLSRKLAVDMYTETKKFARDEIYGITIQLRRASLSMSSNIAEGSARFSEKDRAHFSVIAFSSLMEVLNQLISANDLEYLNEEKLMEFRKKISEIGTKLNALRKSQLSM